MELEWELGGKVSVVGDMEQALELSDKVSVVGDMEQALKVLDGRVVELGACLQPSASSQGSITFFVGFLFENHVSPVLLSSQRQGGLIGSTSGAGFPVCEQIQGVRLVEGVPPFSPDLKAGGFTVDTGSHGHFVQRRVVEDDDIGSGSPTSDSSRDLRSSLLLDKRIYGVEWGRFLRSLHKEGEAKHTWTAPTRVVTGLCSTASRSCSKDTRTNYERREVFLPENIQTFKEGVDEMNSILIQKVGTTERNLDGEKLGWRETWMEKFVMDTKGRHAKGNCIRGKAETDGQVQQGVLEEKVRLGNDVSRVTRSCGQLRYDFTFWPQLTMVFAVARATDCLQTAVGRCFIIRAFSERGQQSSTLHVCPWVDPLMAVSLGGGARSSKANLSSGLFE
ncbi:unnamed protein product [Cyprideis torosa]|uniref:Uncharacterized protein n=1 Tax=Cyprideis torosa TaxID=163714 RepID=A0A7R8ZQW6_9CRUS|nr:unnamed protein product [Cyprideis torosa]CAG0891620.1 unnamed protein product [Cyprideis torosa]